MCWLCVCFCGWWLWIAQISKALDAFAAATKLQPSMPQAWKGMSEVHQSQRQWDKYGQAMESMFDIAVRCVWFALDLIEDDAESDGC